MTHERFSLGKTGEELACSYLQKQGYKIIDRNYRCRSGEIDIIAEDGVVLVFVEVKTRKGESFGHPFEVIGLNKQRKIARSALDYMSVHGIKERDCRFDAVSILVDAHEGVSIELVKNAFEYGGD